MMNNATLLSPLKWVGGKSRLLPAIYDALGIGPSDPDQTWLFVEPFFGSGTVLYKMPVKPEHVIRADACIPLLNLHGCLDEDPALLRARFEMLCQDWPPYIEGPDGRRLFYHIRDKYNERKQYLDWPTSLDYTLAAYFLYINSFGHNGLYRENKSGGCNVPAGYAGKQADRYSKAKVVTLRHLQAFVDAGPLTDVNDFRSWQDALRAMRATVQRHPDRPVKVYLDPPYYKTFCGYGTEWDDEQSTRELVDECQRLWLPPGSALVLSNSMDAETLLDTTKWDEVRYLERSGTMSADANNRGAVEEILAIRRW